MRRHIDVLCDRLDEASRTGETLNMKYMYAAVTLDIINDYCFAKDPENVLKSDFGRKSFDDVDSFVEISLLVSETLSKPTPPSTNEAQNIHIPWIMRFSYYMPVSLGSTSPRRSHTLTPGRTVSTKYLRLLWQISLISEG